MSCNVALENIALASFKLLSFSACFCKVSLWTFTNYSCYTINDFLKFLIFKSHFSFLPSLMLLHAVIVAHHWNMFQFVRGCEEIDDKISYWFSFSIYSRKKLAYFIPTIRRIGITFIMQHYICIWCTHFIESTAKDLSSNFEVSWFAAIRICLYRYIM